MPLLPPDGTAKEHRSAAYVFPNRKKPVFWWSTIAAGVVAVGLFGLHFAGAPQTLSPGPLASHHGNLDVQCAQCHQTGNAVVDLRCERCHDSGFSDRLLHSSHIAMGKGEALEARTIRAPECATCHQDHRGRQFALANVNAGECAECHGTTPSVARHAEFAVVKAGLAATNGMTFGHKDHLAKYLPEKTTARCEYCHEPTPDKRGFVPMDFDRNCGACHTDNGVLKDPSGYIRPDLLLTAEQLPPFWRGQTSVELETNARGNLRGAKLRHRDGWVIANALRLRQAVDPDGARIERVALESAAMNTGARPTSGGALASDASLAATIAGVREDIAAIDRQIAAPAAGPGAATVLQPLVKAVQDLASQLGAASDAAGVATAAAGLALATNAPDPSSDAAGFEWRKTELLALLDAVSARSDAATQAGLKQTAEALRGRVLTLAFAPGPAGDVSALQQRLGELDQLIRLARTVSGQGSQSIDALELERRSVQQRLVGGIDATDLARLRQQLFTVLDAVDARGDDALRARVASVRQRLLSLDLTPADPAGLARARTSRQRLLERLLLEQDLRAKGQAGDIPTRQDLQAVRGGMPLLTTRDRTLLTELQQTAALAPVAGDADPPSNLDAISKLLVACLKCHTFPKPDVPDTTAPDYSKTRLARVRVDNPVMPYAIFNHEPHVTGTKCESCHNAATTSTVATDVNVPGIANCTSCHNPSQVKTTCATCHTYHGATLMASSR